MFLYGRINGIRPEERLARLVLHHELNISVTEAECPDLQNEMLGIEVTRGFPDWYCITEGNYAKFKQASEIGDVAEAKFYFIQSIINTDEVRVDMSIDSNGHVSRQVIQTCPVFDTDLEEIKFAIDRKNAKSCGYNPKNLHLYVFQLGGFDEIHFGTFVEQVRAHLVSTKSPFKTIYIHQIRTRKLLIISQNRFEIKDLDMDYYESILHW